jgi:DNA polymerase-3 subunit delta'
MSLQLNPVTKLQIEATVRNLPQSLLLSGKRGVGLGTIAAFIAGKELATHIQPKNVKGDNDPKTGTISIEIIRELYSQTRTIHKGRRIIIIDDAERMSRGAQAAFLKLLEEPSPSTYFILTSHQPSMLLATIRSRLQQLRIQPLTSTQMVAFIQSQNKADDKKKSQLQFIAPGLPAEIIRLLNDTAYFEAKAKIITDARTFLQAEPYQKLRIAHAYRTSREDTLSLLDGAIAILKHTLSTKPSQGLVAQLERVLETQERISANQSIPLNLAQIVL